MAVVAENAVKIEGLREWLASMQRLEVEAPRKIVRDTLNRAADLVVQAARMRAPVKTGHLRESIRATSTVNYARVSEGNARVPYAGFIDYGGTVGRARKTVAHQRAIAGRTASHRATRPFIKTGRILYPAFQAERLSVITAMNTTLREAVHAVGLRTEA